MTTYIALTIIYLLLIVPIVYLWVNGIDDMHKNHSDYKGEDFLN